MNLNIPPGRGSCSGIPGEINVGKLSTTPTLARPNLRSLDLRSLPKDDGPPSETQLRRQKYLFFEKHCSEVSPGLFLSGDYVAKNRETLKTNSVTHVLNCVGFICKEYFKEELTYKTLFLQDTPAEDIACVLYDSMDYIDNALNSGGRVLVHCSQGVSRSATLVIAYMMWRSGRPYEEVFASVKSVRGVANPNIGFTCQLLQWQKRAATSRVKLRMYRIAPHCAYAPGYLVPKLITPPKQYPHNTHRDLDPRGAFVMTTPGGPTFVWRGAQCPDSYVEAGRRAAQQLRKFEGAGPVIEARQGHEPASLLELLDPAPLDPEAARLNAKRSSITGEIHLPGSGGPVLGDERPGSAGEEGEPDVGGLALGPGLPGLGQAGAAGAGTSSAAVDSMDVDDDTRMHVDLPSARGGSAPQLALPQPAPLAQPPAPPPPPAAIGNDPSLMVVGTAMRIAGAPAGSLSGLLAENSSRSSMELSTPTMLGSSLRGMFSGRDSDVEGGGAGPGPGSGEGGAGAAGGAAAGGRVGSVHRWVLQEVEEYSEDYGLYWHHLHQAGAGAGGAPFDGPSGTGMRVSYDTGSDSLGGPGGGGLLPGGGMGALGPLGGLLAAQGVRPDSPANKERHKKYRRADTERPKLGYWTAACSDGIGPELARTHNVSSLHESVDEDLMGLSPHLSAGAAAMTASVSGSGLALGRSGGSISGAPGGGGGGGSEGGLEGGALGGARGSEGPITDPSGESLEWRATAPM